MSSSALVTIDREALSYQSIAIQWEKTMKIWRSFGPYWQLLPGTFKNATTRLLLTAWKLV